MLQINSCVSVCLLVDLLSARDTVDQRLIDVYTRLDPY